LTGEIPADDLVNMFATCELSGVIDALVADRSTAGTFAACAVLTILSGWYSGMETGLYRFSRLRGELSARSGDRSARSLGRMLADQRLAISVFLIGTNVSNYLAATVVMLYFTRQGRTEGQAELLTTLILTPVLFIFGETIPKAWFYLRPNMLMLRSRPIIAASYWVVKLTGLGYVLRAMTTAILTLAKRFASDGQWHQDAGELADLLRESHAEGALSSVQTGIAERILQLHEERVGHVMVPINRVASMPIDIARDEFLETIRQYSFATIPLYEQHRRDIVGVVNADVVLAQPNRRVRELIEPVMKMPASSSMLDALGAMQRNRASTAIVIDRGSLACGLVTLSDLVQYLLGR